jgi:hypothetical protein
VAVALTQVRSGRGDVPSTLIASGQVEIGRRADMNKSPAKNLLEHRSERGSGWWSALGELGFSEDCRKKARQRAASQARSSLHGPPHR